MRHIMSEGYWSCKCDEQYVHRNCDKKCDICKLRRRQGFPSTPGDVFLYNHGRQMTPKMRKAIMILNATLTNLQFTKEDRELLMGESILLHEIIDFFNDEINGG